MTPGTESNEPKINDLDDAVLKYWDGVQKVLGIESEKLKERVEQDSRQILARAKEEAKRTVDQAKQEAGLESKRIISEAREEAKSIAAQARKEADLESERIIARSKEEAEQAARESREGAYTEGLKELPGVISSINEEVSQIITEVIEHSLARLKDDFVRVSSDARSELENRTTRISTQTREIVEEVISQTKTRTNDKSKHSFKITAEPGKEVQPPAEPNYKKGEESSRQADKVDAASMTPAGEETDSGIPAVPDKPDTQIENNDAWLFKGRYKVEIVCPPYKEPDWSLQDSLAQVPGLKVISADNYLRGNSQIMSNVIELEQPMPLLETIKSKMHIEYVVEHKGKILIKPK